MIFINNTAVASVSAAQAIANFRANGRIAPQTIADGSMNIAASLDGLRTLALAGDIAAIAVTDTRPIAMTFAQSLAGSPVLALLPGGGAFN